jgi:hypothetical protein
MSEIMRYMKWTPLVIVFSLMVIFLTGCKKNDNVVNNPQSQTNSTATQDALYSISANVAIDNSGVLEEMSDVLQTASVSGIVDEDDNSMVNFGNNHRGVTKQYDSTTGWWTITVIRHRGGLLGLYYADYTRVYQDQFLNKNGFSQKFYIVPDGSSFDTAYTFNHKIVSGSGILKTPKVSHQLTALSGAWTVINTNTPVVTLNSSSPYIRSVSDTVSRGDAVRTLNGTLTLNFTNITGPRGSGLNWHRKTSGTITGTYHAVVTFQKGATYTETTIDRIIDITLGGQSIPIRIKGLSEATGTTFYMDAETGEITN